MVELARIPAIFRGISYISNSPLIPATKTLSVWPMTWTEVRDGVIAFVVTYVVLVLILTAVGGPGK